MITSPTLDRPDCVMFTHIIRGRGFQRLSAGLHYMVFLITYNGILNMNKRQKCQLSLPFPSSLCPGPAFRYPCTVLLQANALRCKIGKWHPFDRTTVFKLSSSTGVAQAATRIEGVGWLAVVVDGSRVCCAKSDWNDGGGADLPVVGRRASWETVVEQEAVAKTRKEHDRMECDGSREVMVCVGTDDMYCEGVRPNGGHAEMCVGGIHDGLVRVPCVDDVGAIV